MNESRFCLFVASSETPPSICRRLQAPVFTVSTLVFPFNLSQIDRRNYFLLLGSFCKANCGNFTKLGYYLNGDNTGENGGGKRKKTRRRKKEERGRNEQVSASVEKASVLTFFSDFQPHFPLWRALWLTILWNNEAALSAHRER